MRQNPHLYEINAAVWLNRLSAQRSKRFTLSQVPDKELKAIAEKGIDILWLMGAWRRSPEGRKLALEIPDLRRAYDEALPGWTDADVLGSPYAIFEHALDPFLGEPEELAEFHRRVNRHGMRLMLDFVSNHLAKDHAWTHSFPERFIQVDKSQTQEHPGWFFQTSKGAYLAHGRDPNFPPWTDTVQINFFSPALQEALEDEMLRITRIADGARCDMAMLALNDVFQRQWGSFVRESKPTEEFWSLLIHRAKARRPDFLFLAESYWNMEWELQKTGFDYTYDKVLYDRLKHSAAGDVRGHLKAEAQFQRRSARFIENHDEPRAAKAFGRERSIAAAATAATIPGMRFFHDGQFEGKKIRLPVQLAREPIEAIDQNVAEFYNRLLAFCAEDLTHEGAWQQLTPLPAWEGLESGNNIVAWTWSANGKAKLVAINLSPTLAQARLKLEIPLPGTEIGLHDALTGAVYERSANEMRTHGLYVKLDPWKAHLFDITAAGARTRETSR